MLVQTTKPYNSIMLENIVQEFTTRYSFINSIEIGHSRLGKPIHCLTIGQGDKTILINASHHANEWITTVILLKFLEECTESYQSAFYAGMPDWAKKVTLHFIPMVNPDGVDLVTGFINESRIAYKDAKTMSEGDLFPDCWKANILGVDLNSNYPASWELAKKFKFAKGYTKPGPRDYVGTTPLSEPESCAMAAYTKMWGFDLTISLHTQGEVIYWRYGDHNPLGAAELAKRFSKVSGYELEDVPDYSSHGGYRDWFIETFNRPGFTIECGVGENPLPIEDFDKIYKKTASLLWAAVFIFQKKITKV